MSCILSQKPVLLNQPSASHFVRGRAITAMRRTTLLLCPTSAHGRPLPSPRQLPHTWMWRPSSTANFSTLPLLRGRMP